MTFRWRSDQHGRFDARLDAAPARFVVHPRGVWGLANSLVAMTALAVFVVGATGAGFYAWLVFGGVWLPDLLWPREHILAEATVDGRRFALVQTLGLDFYRTELRVWSSTGASAFIVDPDDGKLWSARLEVPPGGRTLALHCGEERCGSYACETGTFRNAGGDAIEPWHTSTDGNPSS
jgi:hypothetical protein